MFAADPRLPFEFLLGGPESDDIDFHQHAYGVTHQARAIDARTSHANKSRREVALAVNDLVLVHHPRRRVGTPTKFISQWRDLARITAIINPSVVTVRELVSRSGTIKHLHAYVQHVVPFRPFRPQQEAKEDLEVDDESDTHRGAPPPSSAASAPSSPAAVPPLSPASVSGVLPEGMFEVTALLDRRRRGNRWEYLVHWSGFPVEEATWEPRANILVLDALQDYEAQHPLPHLRRRK
ncbi:MAG: chromo domain-containing protein [Edaphobacter sp.]